MSFEKNVYIVVISSLILSILLTAMVFVTGNTFGQRCAVMVYQGEEFNICVKRLAEGI